MVSDWETSTLGELAEIVMGQSPKGSECNSDGHGTPLLNGPTEFGSYHPYPTQFTTDPKRFSKKDDLLFCVRGSTTGRMNWSDKEYAIGRGLAAFRHKKGKEFQSFLKGVIDIKLPELLASATGSTFPNVSKNQLNDLEVILPPLPEQKAIAHILGSLDDKIELNRQMNETLEAMAQALFKSWFVDFDPVIDNALAAGNAIPDEFMERAEQRKKIEKKDNSDIQSLFPDAFEFTEEMGWIPRGWQAVRFADITEAKQGRYLASNQMTALPDDEHTYPVWGGNEVRGFSENFLFDSPVVVLTCRGSNCGLLKITEAESWVTNSSFACTPKFGSAYFLYIYFLNDDFSQSISGSAQPQITYTALKNNLMKFPISEKVVKNLSMRLEVLRSKQISCQKQSETLAKLRETLLPKLMSGELRILDAEALVEDI